MFTGLIEEVGKVLNMQRYGEGVRFKFAASKILEDLSVDDSVSINGVCQTAIEVGNSYFVVESVEETIRKTAFSKLTVGSSVNLERARKFDDRMGGHILQGHIDSIGKIVSIEKETLGTSVWIEHPIEFQKYIVAQGSIGVDGISLTVAGLGKGKFKVAIIPHTFERTTMKFKKIGDYVNIEYDILGKYVINYLDSLSVHRTGKEGSLLNQFFDQPQL
jgi:riboflavin synthase